MENTTVPTTDTQYQELILSIQTQNEILTDISAKEQKIIDGITWIGAVLIIVVGFKLVWWFFHDVLFSGL